MTLHIERSKNSALHVDVKSYDLGPGSEGIFFKLSDELIAWDPEFLPSCPEFTHAEFCGHLSDIIRELSFCECVAATDPRLVFLKQLRSSSLADGWNKAVDPARRMCQRIVFEEGAHEGIPTDIFSDAQDTILEAGRYILLNTDLRVSQGQDGLYFDDPRLHLVDLAKSAQIKPVAKEGKERGFSVRFPSVKSE